MNTGISEKESDAIKRERGALTVSLCRVSFGAALPTFRELTSQLFIRIGLRRTNQRPALTVTDLIGSGSGAWNIRQF